MFTSDIISIHLNKFKTSQDFDKVLLDNGLTLFNGTTLMYHKESGYLKFFVDKSSQKIVGYVHKDNKKDIILDGDFHLYLKNLKSIDFEKDKELALNSILDKISEKGMSSLSKKEVEFLEKFNKN